MQDLIEKGSNLIDRAIFKASKLAQNKLAVGLIAALFFGSIFSAAVSTPATQAQNSTPTDFGVGQIDNSTQLGDRNLIDTVSQIINVALGLLGIVAVVVILIGGFKWMTASGNEEQVDEARDVIFQGIIGLAIVLSAWAITRFVISNLSEATGSGTGSDGGFNTN